MSKKEQLKKLKTATEFYRCICKDLPQYAEKFTAAYAQDIKRIILTCVSIHGSKTYKKWKTQ